MRGDEARQAPDSAASRGRHLARVGVALLVLAPLLLLIGAWFWLTRSVAPVWNAEAQPTRPPAASQPPARPAVALAALAPTSGSPPPPPPDDPIARYREQTRYAPNSGALHETALDLIEPNRRYEQLRPIGDTVGRGAGEEVRFVLTADKYYYEGDDVVKLRLEVARGGSPTPVAIKLAQAVAENASGKAGEEVQLDLGLSAGVYSAELDLAESFAEHHGPILFEIEFEYAAGKRQAADLRVFTTPVNSIPARFVGRYRDAPENGSLLVEAAVEVYQPGFYRLDANLFSQDGVPLAFANFKGDLEPGLHWVPLEFFGLLLIDLGVAGPYEVRNVRGYRFLDGEYPDRLRMRDAPASYWTHAYDLAGFSDEEYMTPHKAQVLELLQQDVQAGIAVDMPGEAEGL